MSIGDVIMVIEGPRRTLNVRGGRVEVVPNMLSTVGWREQILGALRTGESICRMLPDEQGVICAPDTHWIAPDLADIVRKRYPRVEWHRLRGLKMPVAVATVGADVVALCGPQTSDARELDIARRYREYGMTPYEVHRS